MLLDKLLLLLSDLHFINASENIASQFDRHCKLHKHKIEIFTCRIIIIRFATATVFSTKQTSSWQEHVVNVHLIVLLAEAHVLLDSMPRTTKTLCKSNIKLFGCPHSDA